MYEYGSPEAGDSQGMATMESTFSSKSIRHAFIRKVYSILCVQLIITFGCVIIFSNSEGVKKFAAQNFWIIIVCFIVSFASVITMACCEGMRRKTPHNFIILAIFTAAEAFLMGFITAFYKTEIVLYAIIMTAVVVAALTAFAFQTKYDFTIFNGIMVVVLFIFIIFGILAMFFHNKIMQIVYASLGAIIFSIFLVIDTQMVVGGTHKYQISPEDYIFASLTLYLDIINLFLYILQLFNSASD